jgi:hypothetical protein
VAQPKTPIGTVFLWAWKDREIDDPKRLKGQLLQISSCGFSTVLVDLHHTRYEFIDRKVIRTLAQASQWAKKRNIHFWIQIDPRQASRSLISNSGERTQNLIIAPHPQQNQGGKIVNVSPIQNNHFELRYDYPKTRQTEVLQEVSINFEPSGLERVFVFQAKDGVVIRDTLRDITSTCHFFANVKDGYVEVYGDVLVPEGESWWAVAFPRFDTNHFDYAGRDSNDYLHHFVEDLFDGCTHLDGFTWGKDTTGYVTDIGRLPVSPSLYNCFKAECGYDLRDVLYALVLDLDDGSHVKVRYDYYTLLMSIVFGAQKDFYRMIHSFFDGLGIGTHHTLRFDTQRSKNLVQGCIDPWRGLKTINATFFEMEKTLNGGSQYHSIFSSMVFTKSLGVFSENQHAYFQIQHTDVSPKTLTYWLDLANLFRVECVIHSPLYSKEAAKKSEKLILGPNRKLFHEYNLKSQHIRALTGFNFPEANVALVFPMETIMTVTPQKGEMIMKRTNDLTANLVSAGIQLDVISPILLKKGHLSPNGLRVQNRVYESVIFPYPEVLDPAVLEVISLMLKFGLPILLGGSKPNFTTQGKRIPHVFPLAFDPEDQDLSALWEHGLTRMFQMPPNSIGTSIRRKRHTLFLLCPNKMGGSFSGKVVYKNIEFSVPKSNRLVIFRAMKKGEVEQIL